MQHSFGCLLAGEDRAQRVTGRRVVTLPSFSSTRWRPQWGRSGIDHLYLSVFLLNSNGCQQGRIISECSRGERPQHMCLDPGAKNHATRGPSTSHGALCGELVSARAAQRVLCRPPPPPDRENPVVRANRCLGFAYERSQLHRRVGRRLGGDGFALVGHQSGFLTGPRRSSDLLGVRLVSSLSFLAPLGWRCNPVACRRLCRWASIAAR